MCFLYNCYFLSTNYYSSSFWTDSNDRSISGGDCIEFKEKYPNCKAPRPFKIGDGTCDGGEYNTEECGFDEGDCDRCQVSDSSIIGDGECNGGETLTEECNFDAGVSILFILLLPLFFFHYLRCISVCKGLFKLP